MFYFVFKKVYAKIKKMMAQTDAKRFQTEKLPKGVIKNVFNYNDLNEFNIYETTTPSKTLIIDIHGGGFVYGDKDTNNNFCFHLANFGYKVVSLTYRLVDGNTFLIDQIHDIFTFFNHLYENKDKYSLNFDQVILTGDSAGGMLALLAYVLNNDADMAKIFGVNGVLFNIKGLILNHQICYIDLTSKIPGHPILSNLVAIPGIKRMLYGKDYKKSNIYNFSLRPDHFIFRDTKLCPILLISSQGDKAFLPQTTLLYNYLKGLDKKVTMYLENDSNALHVFNISYPDSPKGKKCNYFLNDFIKECINE